MPPNWDAIGYVISSKYRLAVVRSLANEPATPTTIAEIEGVSTTHVSRALRRLQRRSIVELAVPETQRKNRLYELTAKGEAIWEEIQAKGLTS